MGRDLAAMRTAFAALASIPDAEWDRMSSRVRVRVARKGEMLLREGERADWLAWLESGLVRTFCLTTRGEVNVGFECEGGFVGAYQAYTDRVPAPCGLQALEPSRLVVFERHVLDGLLRAHPCWGELSRRGAESELARKIAVELEVRTKTPAERYAALVRARSFLVRRVPLYHLASYLGIAPETLSRIRARRGTAAPASGGS